MFLGEITRNRIFIKALVQGKTITEKWLAVQWKILDPFVRNLWKQSYIKTPDNQSVQRVAVSYCLTYILSVQQPTNWMRLIVKGLYLRLVLLEMHLCWVGTKEDANGSSFQLRAIAARIGPMPFFVHTLLAATAATITLAQFASWKLVMIFKSSRFSLI